MSRPPHIYVHHWLCRKYAKSLWLLQTRGWLRTFASALKTQLHSVSLGDSSMCRDTPLILKTKYEHRSQTHSNNHHAMQGREHGGLSNANTGTCRAAKHEAQGNSSTPERGSILLLARRLVSTSPVGFLFNKQMIERQEANGIKPDTQASNS